VAHRTPAPRTSPWCAALLLSVLLASFPSAAAPAPRIAAAANLGFALTEIAEQFARDTGDRIELVFGASGALARQITDGAPFELFLAADEEFPDRLSAAGLTRDAGAVYAVGRLVLFAPTGSPLVVDPGLRGLETLLASGSAARFAIANPATAPYGRAAEAVLRRHGLWARAQPRLVLGETIAQAAQFATTGNAAGGLIAYSLALSPTLSDRGTYALIPTDDHPPLRQKMVVLKKAGPAAERFYEYMQGPRARGILQRFGFDVPR
jgi:molybdate transport system substrate-binding protein